MLSVFPDLLAYTLLGVAIVRIAIGLFLFVSGISTLTNKKVALTKYIQEKGLPFADFWPWFMGILMLIVGGFLIIGFLTQVSTIVAIYLLIKMLFIDWGKKKIYGNTPLVYLVLIMISASLIFSGAGFLAVDLPL